MSNHIIPIGVPVIVPGVGDRPRAAGTLVGINGHGQAIIENTLVTRDFAGEVIGVDTFHTCHYMHTVEIACEVCEHRVTAYGLGPCDAHNGDVWPTRKDN